MNGGLGQSEFRLAFHHGTGIRKRVKRLQAYVFAKSLDMNETHRSKSHSSARLEPVDQAIAFLALIDLLGDRKKCLGFDNVQLEFTLVMDTILEGRLFLAN